MAGASGAVSDGRARRLREHEFILIVQHLDALTFFALVAIDPVELAAHAAEPVVTTVQPVSATPEPVESVVTVSITVDAFFFGFPKLPEQHPVGLTVHAGQ